jgi:hypothetical protein
MSGAGLVPGPLRGTNFGWGVPRGDTVLEIRDLTKGRIKNGVPVGEWTLRVDVPHSEALYPHINTQGVSEAVIANHTPVSPTALSLAENAAPIARTAQRGLVVAAVGADGYELYRAYDADGQTVGKNTVTAAGGIAGSWAGGWAGAEGGAAGGAAPRTLIAPGPGTVIGGIVGGIAGGIGGALGGRSFGRWAAGSFFE